MYWLKQAGSGLVMKSMGLYLRAFYEFRVWGRDHVPKGPAIYCSNHFSSLDPFFVLTLMREPTHMVIDQAFRWAVWRNVLELGEHINATPAYRGTVVQKAVHYLEKGEAVYIFPEGMLNDQTELLQFYTGIARIYLARPCPIVPIGIVAPRRYVKEKVTHSPEGMTTHKTLTVFTGKYYANIGKPLLFPHLEENPNSPDAAKALTDDVRDRISELINEIKTQLFWS